MASSRSSVMSSDDEPLDIDDDFEDEPFPDDDEEEISLVDEEEEEEEKPSATPQRRRIIEENIRPAQKSFVSKKEEEELLDENEIELIDEDEEVQIPPPVQRKTFSRTNFRASQSRGTGSPSASVSLGFKLRNTARPTDRVDPDFNDLYAVFGKYLKVPDLHNILENSVETLKVADFNRRNNTNYHAASSENKVKKSVNRSIKKDMLVARVLRLPIARAMAVDFLKNVPRRDKKKRVFDEDFSLSDPEIFIQFTDDGPKFPGDSEDIEALEKASGSISVTSRGSKERETVENLPPRFTTKLLGILNKAVSDDNNPHIQSEKRIEIISDVLLKLSNLNSKQLRMIEEYAEELLEEKA